ncbi:hypothetical protein [Caballeronia zhejiangensis]|uniref:hypothetical protein n=1 Tax=Caballeronia zhejiangensis TaxID=871203 RepID=UPI001EF51BEE|nr:hypothetical protein [Caballeronia zhejiangensis]MCG7405216.1 hypothetical protein [Caballeronia zhejiangensis]MCI1047353.1 hypothetical protein [Caballeronia zhejiangensis]
MRAVEHRAVKPHFAPFAKEFERSLLRPQCVVRVPVVEHLFENRLPVSVDPFLGGLDNIVASAWNQERVWVVARLVEKNGTLRIWCRIGAIDPIDERLLPQDDSSRSIGDEKRIGWHVRDLVGSADDQTVSACCAIICNATASATSMPSIAAE